MTVLAYLPYAYGAYGFDLVYMGIVLLSLVLGVATQGYINSTYRKWSKVPNSSHKTGAEIAREMLDNLGSHDTSIRGVSGHLTDHFDPRDNSLNLSQDNLSGGSVASVAVACHEAGHAVQTAKGYAFGKLRTALVPVVNFAQGAWSYLLLLGIFMNITGLTTLAIIMFSATVLFQLVTLPVEIDASRRAVAYLKEIGRAHV